MIRIAPDVAPLVLLGALDVEDVRVVERLPALDEALAALEARLRTQPPPDADIAAVRTLYRRVGLDPTRVRPSSEALRRRVVKGGTLPRINSLVDVCNWCSAELQLPYGLYDREAIEGVVELRFGVPGEEYAGIRRDVVHLGGRLTLADARGPFGNPTADSARTMVTVKTRRALAVVYAPAAAGAARVAAALDLTASRMAGYCGARETARAILPEPRAPNPAPRVPGAGPGE